MSDPYLIAHLVRGQPAFDIAERLGTVDEDGEEMWIIPTSGHRAYPYADWLLFDVANFAMPESAPQDWPDHYPHSASPRHSTTPDLRSLGLAKPQPKIERRI